MKNQNISVTIVAQLKPSKQLRQHEGQFEGRSPQEYRQLGLFDPQDADLLPQVKSQKPQVSRTPGTSPKELFRYRVTFQGQILGDHLSIDQAIELAKRGGCR
jgi:hypothetical protein